MNVFDELSARGLIAQTTGEQAIRERLDKPLTFYIGFDPTADSLHVGHFVQLMVMAHMQRAGHRPIALIGGGTAMVGDPTGKTDMRQMMTPERIAHNGEQFKKQMARFLDFFDGKALLLNNADWLLPLNYVDFLREVGVHFSVNRMLTAECFKSRMERGLSFLEFNYMLMQGYDFYYLSEHYGCTMQLGGDDQWSNILGGVELCRRKAGREVFGMTFRLLETAEGKKMGKTEKGAVWLDAEKTSPYDFFQYWRNVEDSDVQKCLLMLTFLPVEDIRAMAADMPINEQKETLAYEVTALVHGAEEAAKARAAARALFGPASGGSAGSGGAAGEDGEANAHMPTTKTASRAVLDLLVETGLAPSRGEARRLILQGGVRVDDAPVSDPAAVIGEAAFEKGYVILKKGKKVFHKVEKV
ncbi:MAG: tyrosine--tRNA ligase [Oscillospiraceae bacterium]|nr:tyrosine--tRNA ligase [Oscillospiraceae bacterium]